MSHKCSYVSLQGKNASITAGTVHSNFKMVMSLIIIYWKCCIASYIKEHTLVIEWVTFTLIYSIDLCNSLTVHTVVQQQWPGQGYSNEWDAMKYMHNNDYCVFSVYYYVLLYSTDTYQ